VESLRIINDVEKWILYKSFRWRGWPRAII
jgi:hypothetical protein